MSISFSENGYNVATCEDSSSVKLWDLRKTEKLLDTVNISDKTIVTKIEFDHTGNYLSLAGDVPSVYSLKTSKLISSYEKKKSKKCSSFKFEGNDKYLVSTSLEGEINVYSNK